MEYLQVAIDGPAGSGKSTIAKGLAKKLGFLFINSGAFYRAVTVAVIENKISLTDEKKIINLLKKLSVTQINDDIYLNNQNVSNKCWTHEINSVVPMIAKIKEVRSFCSKAKIDLSKKNNIVIEGRDTTTVLFPNAVLKCWLFASPEIRAKRRWEQLGKSIPLKTILGEILSRDKLDTERAISPMIKANNAFELDTSNIKIDNCITILLNEFKKLTNRKF